MKRLAKMDEKVSSDILHMIMIRQSGPANVCISISVFSYVFQSDIESIMLLYLLAMWSTILQKITTNLQPASYMLKDRPQLSILPIYE